MDKKYIYIDNMTEFGKFNAHHSDKHEVLSILRPVYKINKSENDQDTFVLIPGYIDTDNRFFECPFDIFYVQLDKIIQFQKYKNPTMYCKIDAYLKIFSKDFSKFRIEKLSYESKGRSILDFMNFNRIINIINEFINRGKDIDDLAIDKVSTGSPYEQGKSIVLGIVNSLKFEFFESSRNRVGKDNFFWESATVTDLPTDNYLKKLIIDNLFKQCSKISYSENIIGMQFQINEAFAPSFETRRLENQEGRDTSIKDLLKLDLAIAYNSRDHLFEKLTKSNFAALDPYSKTGLL